jgi:tetratricopeptide (TPR) repeat protein
MKHLIQSLVRHFGHQFIRLDNLNKLNSRLSVAETAVARQVAVCERLTDELNQSRAEHEQTSSELNRFRADHEQMLAELGGYKNAYLQIMTELGKNRLRPPTPRPGPVCFMHIGKVGGQAICRELFGRFDIRRIFNSSSELMDVTMPEALQNYDLILGHWSYCHVAKLPRPRFLFSMVRDPVDRVLSNYGFLRSHQGPVDETSAESVRLAKELELEDFLEHEHPQVRSVVDNHQTRFFAEDWRGAQRTTPETLKAALSHLDEFDFIGIHERYHESLQALCALLDWTPWPAGIRVNVTPRRRRVADLPARTLERIRALNAFDLELVDRIRARFEAQFRDILERLVAVNYRLLRRSSQADPADRVYLGFDQGVFGNGWHYREQNERDTFRWLGPGTSASVTVEVAAATDMIVEAHVVDWTDWNALDSLALSVCGEFCQRCAFNYIDNTSEGRRAALQWIVPLKLAAAGTPFLDLNFHTSPAARQRQVGKHDREDRLASLAVGVVRVFPVAATAAGDTAGEDADLVALGREALHGANGRVSRIVEAERLFTRATQKDPGDPNAFFWLAESICYQGRATEALPALQSALALLNDTPSRPLQPELQPRLHERLGEALMMSDKLAEAAPHLQQAVALQPQNDRDRYRLNSARYLLEGVEQSRKLRVGPKVARWPVKLDDFANLDKVIRGSVVGAPTARPLIHPRSRIVTLGSCFAMNIAHSLTKVGVSARPLGLGELINSTFANRALLEWASGEPAPTADAEVINVLKTYFGDSPEQIRSAFAEADLVVFTLGVAPAFFDRQSGAFYLACPNVNTRHLLASKIFRTTTVEENVANIEYIAGTLRRLNPRIETVFTVSPVPLYGTFEYDSAIVADCVSKATLRVAIDTVMKRHPEGVRYWPAFEIVRWLGAYHGPMYGAEDGTSRHVSEYAIDAIVRAFLETYGDPALRSRLDGTADARRAA